MLTREVWVVAGIASLGMSLIRGMSEMRIELGTMMIVIRMVVIESSLV